MTNYKVFTIRGTSRPIKEWDYVDLVLNERIEYKGGACSQILCVNIPPFNTWLPDEQIEILPKQNCIIM